MELALIVTMVCILLFMVLINKCLNRICKLEKNQQELEENYEKLTLDVVSLDKRVDDVRKSLDNY